MTPATDPVSQAAQPLVWHDILGLSPAVRAALEPPSSLQQAQELTRALAHEHYENFSVVSRLLPKHLRQDFCNVYAFCRIADDLGDELGDAQKALECLGRFRQQTRACYARDKWDSCPAIFTALGDTIAHYEIPIEPFLDLIDAFEQDHRVRRYQTFDELLDYCRRSANPVGRIVLYVCGYRDPQRQQLSDLICTALQLANFWQDVRRDLLDLGRTYLSAESMQRFGVTEAQIRDGHCNEAFKSLLKFEVDRTEAMFEQGEALLPMLEPGIRSHIALFGMGGRAILQAIRKQDYDTLSRRPTLSAWQKGKLITVALANRLKPSGSPGGRGR